MVKVEVYRYFMFIPHIIKLISYLIKCWQMLIDTMQHIPVSGVDRKLTELEYLFDAETHKLNRTVLVVVDTSNRTFN